MFFDHSIRNSIQNPDDNIYIHTGAREKNYEISRSTYTLLFLFLKFIFPS